VTLANALYGWWVLPESLPREHRRTYDWRRANPLASLAGLRRRPLVFGMGFALFLFNLGNFGVHSTWVLYTAHRYGWGPRDVGSSLAVVGLTAAIVQGWLGRVIIPALGERVTLLGGFLLGAVSLSAYGFATQGWMIYAILPFGAMAGLGGQAGQAIISKAVPINEQGAVQGALTGLNSVAGFVAPMLAANLFSYFIGGKAPMHLPGIAFFEGGLLQILGLCVAVATLRRHPSRGTTVPTTA